MCLLDGLSKVVPSLLPIDKKVVKAMFLRDEEGHQRRKQVVGIEEEDSEEEDDDEDGEEA